MNVDQSGVSLVGKPVYYPGYMFGLNQPSMVARIRFDQEVEHYLADCPGSLGAVDQAMRAIAQLPDDISLISVLEKRIDCLFYWMCALLEMHQQPVLNLPRASKIQAGGHSEWVLVLPCLDSAPILAALQTGLKALSMAHLRSAKLTPLLPQLAELVREKAPYLKSQALTGFNTLHFIKEAHRLCMPWFRFSRNIFQLGYGVHSRLLLSSTTDTTGNIAVALARNKQQANALLRDAGMPVPEQGVVTSADESVSLARRIGYPVVIKPADLDGGVGVSALLQDERSVRAAYAHAAEHSKNIIIEKHIEGNDYRILVVNGQVLGVVERSPGGVTGDGVRTIRELVELQNHERAMATDERRYLHPIEADQEAERMLGWAGVGWDTVPVRGDIIRLRAAANVATGGMPREIPVADMHPDNLALARRVARVLRLDVAGIDLLMPDIRRSWMESGAGICEVNAQPQMFTTMHAPMLQALMRGTQGRIPVVVILTSSSNCEISAKLYERMLEIYPVTGWVSNSVVRLGGQPVMRSSRGIFDASRALLMDDSVEALVVSVSDSDILATGWPCDQCDVLLFVGDRDVSRSSHSRDLLRRLGQSTKTLQPKLVFVDREDELCQSMSREIDWLRSDGDESAAVTLMVPREEMIQKVIDTLSHTA